MRRSRLVPVGVALLGLAAPLPFAWSVWWCGAWMVATVAWGTPLVRSVVVAFLIGAGAAGAWAQQHGMNSPATAAAFIGGSDGDSE